MTTLKTIDSGTELEKEKAYRVFDDIQVLAYDHEYDEIIEQVLVKDHYNWYGRLAKIMLYDFKISLPDELAI